MWYRTTQAPALSRGFPLLCRCCLSCCLCVTRWITDSRISSFDGCPGVGSWGANGRSFLRPVLPQAFRRQGTLQAARGYLAAGVRWHPRDNRSAHPSVARLLANGAQVLGRV